MVGSSLTTVRSPSEDPARVYLAGLSEGSRPTVYTTLNALSSILRTDWELIPWSELRYQHTTMLRSKLIDLKLSPGTVNKMLYHLKGILKQTMLLGQMTQEDYVRAASIEPVRGARIARGRALTQDELHSIFFGQSRLLSADEPIGARNLALVALEYGAGLRTSGAVVVRMADDRGESIRVVGKGNKEREVPLPAGARAALDNWYSFRGKTAGPILCPFDRYGRPHPGESISRSGAWKILHSVFEAAGVAGATPHDLRRTLVTTMLGHGVDAGTVQKLVGHASIQTTMRYDKRGFEAMEKAMETVDVPFPRKAS